MKKIRIAILGSSGRMGMEIINLINSHEQFEYVGGVSRSKKQQVGLETHDISNLDPKNIDVLIDFSLPEGFLTAVEWCLKNKKPLISGTTGLTAEHMSVYKKAAQSIPVLWAPNMSIGVAVLQNALKTLPNIEGFDYQIEEFHHIHKKDKPSGTALLLQNTLETSGIRTVSPPISIRGGGIFGVHKVHLMSGEETLCFEHTALNRTVFARGALMAAKWILVKDPGCYHMSDVIRLS